MPILHSTQDQQLRFQLNSSHEHPPRDTMNSMHRNCILPKSEALEPSAQPLSTSASESIPRMQLLLDHMSDIHRPLGPAGVELEGKQTRQDWSKPGR
eukprot:gene22076-biopygen7764